MSKANPLHRRSTIAASRPPEAAKHEKSQESAQRLLMRLAAPGVHAERSDGIVSLIDGQSAGDGVIARMPSSALSPLVESGAVICRFHGGTARFTISEAGRAALFRHGLARKGGIDADAQADQHRVIIEHEVGAPGARERVRVNLRDDPLAMLARQKDGFATDFIGAAAIEAGRRLQRDMATAQIEPRMGVDLGRVSVDGGLPGGMLSLPERAMEARRRVNAALAAAGPDHAGLLMDVCGFSKGLETVEAERRLPARSGKLWLGLALRALARHYGLSDEARGARGGGIRAARFPTATEVDTSAG